MAAKMAACLLHGLIVLKQYKHDAPRPAIYVRFSQKWTFLASLLMDRNAAELAVPVRRSVLARTANSSRYEK